MERSEFSNSGTLSSEGSAQDLNQKISQSDEASSNHHETVNPVASASELTQTFSSVNWYN